MNIRMHRHAYWVSKSNDQIIHCGAVNLVVHPETYPRSHVLENGTPFSILLHFWLKGLHFYISIEQLKHSIGFAIQNVGHRVKSLKFHIFFLERLKKS